MNSLSSRDIKAINILIGISLLALLGLVWLIYFSNFDFSGSDLAWVKTLPAVNATLNSIAAVFLIIGRLAISKKKINLHKWMMVSAFVASALFLGSYITYHAFHGDTKFMGMGIARTFYFFILISHIVLSGINLPMILLTFYFVIAKKMEMHRKLARWTFPIWLYVSVTGVIIFFMLKSYNVT